jgi:hypothetical protein
LVTVVLDDNERRAMMRPRMAVRPAALRPAAVLSAAVLLAALAGCGSGGSATGSPAGPHCTVVSPDRVAMVVTADGESPGPQCTSAEQGGYATDGLTGPWHAGSDPGGQPVCSAFNVGITLTFYDPGHTGGATGDCTALQETLSWQITWYQQSG